MFDEILLHNKINTLQVELLNFNKKINLTKHAKQIEENGNTKKSKFLSTCTYIVTGLLKVLACITGPTIFPSIIYCIEGSSQLFWQVTVISCIITLLLAMMVISVLYINIKKIKIAFEEIIYSLIMFVNQVGIKKFISEIFVSDFIKKNMYRVLYPLVMLFLTTLLGFIAYVRKISLLFYGSLMVSGYIGGILSTIIYDIFRNQEFLPYYSPYKMKIEITTSTPQLKKELDFSNFRKPDPSSTYHNSTPMAIPLPGTDTELMKSAEIAALLPKTLSPVKTSYQEVIQSTWKMWLPLNMKYFSQPK